MARILVVDDKEQDRYLLKVMLEKSGYDTVTADNGEQALVAARQTPPDLIVSDILMPVMDGFTLCREWKRTPDLQRIPFVFYTATYTDPRDEEFALSQGADRFIAKPIEPEEFLRALKDELRKKAASKVFQTTVVLDEGEKYFKDYSEVLVRKLEDKLTLFRAMFNADPNMILMLSPSHVVLEINQSAANVLGVRSGEVIETDFVDRFVPLPARGPFSDLIDKAYAGTAVYDREGTVRDTSGEQHIVRWNACAVSRSSGAIEGILLIGSDITDIRRIERERKELEEQLRRAQRMEAIGAFAGGIAHDFNNILTGIFGFVDMVRSDLAPDSRSARYLKDALTAAQRAKRLVGQILFIARGSEGASEPVDLRVVIKEAHRLLRASIPAGVELVLNVSPDPCMVMADPTQVHQVVMNLGTNAFHALEGKQGTIRISCLSHPRIENHTGMVPGFTAEDVALEVSDTGSGMGGSTLDHIFDPYFTTKEKGKGTGLGLSVVKAIVEAHGGRIDCESVVGKGSVFRIYFPKMQDFVREMETGTNQGWDRGENEMILLVEDDETNGSMLEKVLPKLGYRCLRFANGAEAMASFMKEPSALDIVLTDLNMPRMGGLELTQNILSKRPKTPVILMSGSIEALPLNTLTSAGLTGYLRKPFTIEDLSRVLRTARTKI